MNPGYFVCLIIEYFFPNKSFKLLIINDIKYQNTTKNANITLYIKKKEKKFATP